MDELRSRLSRTNAASLAAVTALLAQAGFADAGTQAIVGQAQAAQQQATKFVAIKPPPLTLKPGGQAAVKLRGGRGHSSHSSHSSHYSGGSSSGRSSHSSHYSSSVGGGSSGGTPAVPRDPDPTPPPSPPPLTPTPTPPPPRPTPPPAPPARSTPLPPRSVKPSATYSSRVFLRDSRIIDCDITRDGSDVLLVKRGGTIRVRQVDIDHIDPIPAAATQPTTAPAEPGKAPDGR